MNPSTLIDPSRTALISIVDDGIVTLAPERTAAPVAASEGCLQVLWTALGRCLDRRHGRATGYTARYQRTATTPSGLKTNSPAQAMHMPKRQPMPEEARREFLALQPNRAQTDTFDELQGFLQSTTAPSQQRKWKAAIDRLSQLVDQSRDLQSQCNNERAQLLTTLQHVGASGASGPYEHILRMTIHHLIAQSYKAQSEFIGGNTSALVLLESAGRHADDLMQSRELFKDKGDPLCGEIIDTIAGLNPAGTQSDDLAIIGYFLATMEGLRDVPAVMDALQFISRCLQRRDSLVHATNAARVRARLCKQHVPPDKASQVAQLLRGAGPTDISDMLKVANYLLAQKRSSLEALEKTGLRIAVCRHDITNYVCGLKGVIAPTSRAAQADATTLYWDDKKVCTMLDRNPPLLVVALTQVDPPPPAGAEAVPASTTFEVPPAFDAALLRTLQNLKKGQRSADEVTASGLSVAGAIVTEE
ncbi:hypothetical protein SAMN05216359_105210 [Roseateles sp. YR242]|uniref:hypothetical protein n=1 Tax=Roseateles sp. YR242 TaxID=1855305 RepID=UPI0008BFABAE|nr:hypothetical protein [Roseateles sp. YR242]SEL10774.1 hypothetical protein SAMN05216359_105210 [Roseateles sp. YR242]